MLDDPIWTKIIAWYYDNGYPMAGYFNQQIRREWIGHDARILLRNLEGPSTVARMADASPRRKIRRGQVRTANYDFTNGGRHAHMQEMW